MNSMVSRDIGNRGRCPRKDGIQLFWNSLLRIGGIKPTLESCSADLRIPGENGSC
jgi:hypothetical protein